MCQFLFIKDVCFAEPALSYFRPDKSKQNQNIGYQITATENSIELEGFDNFNLCPILAFAKLHCMKYVSENYCQ